MQAIVKGKCNKFEVEVFMDTGSRNNLISVEKYNQLFSHLPLEKKHFSNLAGIVNDHKIHTLGIIDIPLKLASELINVETIVASNVNYTGDLLLGFNTMREYNVIVHPGGKGIFINDDFVPFIEKPFMQLHCSHVNFASGLEMRQNNTAQKPRKRGILKRKIQHPDMLSCDWENLVNKQVLGRHGNAHPRKKLATFNLRNCIIKEDNSGLNWEYCNPNIVPTLRNLHKNKYKIVFLAEAEVPTYMAEVALTQLIDEVIAGIGVPIQVLIGKGDFVKKPKTNLWHILEDYYNNEKKVDRKYCFYVGNSILDKLFTERLEIDYFSASKFFNFERKRNLRFDLNTPHDSEVTYAESNHHHFEKETPLNNHVDKEPLETNIVRPKNTQHLVGKIVESVTYSHPIVEEENVTLHEFDNDEPDICNIENLIVKEDIELEAQNSAWIKCKIRNKDSKYIVAITLPENTKVIGLILESGIHYIENNVISVKVYNCRSGNIRLEKGTCIGEVELYDHEVIIENPDKVENTHNVHSVTQTSNAMNSDRVNKITNELNIVDFPEHREKLVNLLRKYDDIIAVKGDKLGVTNKIFHHIAIPENTKPIYIPSYRVPHSQKEIIEEGVKALEQDGIVEQSNTPWKFPLICVPKRDGTHRIVVDFRKLNALTQTDPYPMPSMQDLINSIGSSTFFTTIDLLHGFLQVPLDETSKLKTGFSTSTGHYVFNRMPFGLKSSPVTFVRLIDSVFKGILGKIVHVYIDDIIVTGNTIEEHLANLELVLERLRKANLKIKLSKCNFLKEKCVYLGHELSKDGIKVTKDKIEAVEKFKQPTDVKSLRSFLGLSGFYRRFIKDYAKIAAPLTDLLKKDSKYSWEEEQQKAFQKLKSALTSAPILVLPDFTKPFTLVTDASGIGIGSALMQKCPETNKYRVIAYHSRKLNKAEKNYGITEQEALAVIDSLKHFRYIIFGYKVKVKTDHIALKDIFNKPNHSGRRARWFLTAMDYDVEFEYLPGSQNSVADCLSRYTVEENIGSIHVLPIIDHEKIKLHQQADKTIELTRKLINGEINSTRNKPYLPIDDLKIIDGVVFKIINEENKILIPKTLVKEILNEQHDSRGHPGRDETLSQIKLKYYWKGMSVDVKNYIIKCKKCAECKGNTQIAPMNRYPVPQNAFERVAVDLLKLHTTYAENNYILVCCDTLTRFIELYAQKSKNAKETAENIHRFILRYGAPDVIVSDNGLEFCNTILKELATLYHVKKVNIMPYQPASNGLIERANRTIRDTLKLTLTPDNRNWDEHLESVQYLLNTKIHSSIQMSPYRALFGFQPRKALEINTNRYKSQVSDNPIEARINNASMIHSKLKDALRKTGLTMQMQQHKNASKTKYKVGDHIYLKKDVLGVSHKVEPNYIGPYEIIRHLEGNKYVIKYIESGEEKTAHSDKFKLFTINNSQQEAEEMHDSTQSETENESIELEKVSIENGNNESVENESENLEINDSLEHTEDNESTRLQTGSVRRSNRLQGRSNINFKEFFN